MLLLSLDNKMLTFKLFTWILQVKKEIVKINRLQLMIQQMI